MWDAGTLDRFLQSPTTLVSGSAMLVSVTKESDRDDLIAYLQTVKEGTFREAPSSSAPSLEEWIEILAAFGCHAPKGEVEKVTRVATDSRAVLKELGCKPVLPKNSSADWVRDAPGRRHTVRASDLPAPFMTPPGYNPARVVSEPSTARLRLPKKFQVNVFASGLEEPRRMLVAPNGDIFVAESSSGRVKLLRPAADGSRAVSVTIFAQGLLGPFGMQLFPSGPEPRWLYVAETNRVVRYAYQLGDMQASSVPEVVVAELTPSPGGHSTRDLAFSKDGQRMFVSVGSASDDAEGMSTKAPEEVRTWEATHNVGATWDGETRRADVLVFEIGSIGTGKIFATGLRNCVGLTLQHETGELWCTTNERNGLGEDLVPDFSTRLRDGGFYGWPWYYIGAHVDPTRKGQRPDLAGKVIVPDVLYQAHSAPLNLVFYTANCGRAVFPRQYWGDGFAVLHGSTNRAFRTGHKVVRVRMKHGIPTGKYDDFLVGFILDNERVWGRPVDAAVASDGSLLVSDDSANQIYRIAYESNDRRDGCVH